MTTAEYLATHGHHTCTSWPCSQPGMHRIPNGMWPDTERLIPARRPRSQQQKETPEQRAERLEIARKTHAATFSRYRDKATAAIREMSAKKAATIVAEYDGTKAGCARLAEKYGYKYENMRKMLRRNGCELPR